MREREKLIQKLLMVSALTAVLVVVLITFFIFKTGFPVLAKVGFFNFVFGREWGPTRGSFGIYSMIIGTFAVTCGALLLGVPLGIACAIFLAEVSPARVAKIVRPMIELLAGIPSVVYGFYGLVVIVPYIRKYFGGPGFSVLAGSIILAIMILPTVISIAEDAIRAVPHEYKEGSLALGATRWQTISGVILPAARSGIVAGIILGMGRAIGETMAVIMVTGNVTKVPQSALEPVRTLTGNVILEMGYAAGEHRQALFATGIILFIIIMLLNLAANFVAKKAGE